MLLGLSWIISLRLSLKDSCYCKHFDFPLHSSDSLSTTAHRQQKRHLLVHHRASDNSTFTCISFHISLRVILSLHLKVVVFFIWLTVVVCLYIYFRHWFWGAGCLSGGLRFGLQWVLQRSQCKLAAIDSDEKYDRCLIPCYFHAILILYSMYNLLILIVFTVYCFVQMDNYATHA